MLTRTSRALGPPLRRWSACRRLCTPSGAPPRGAPPSAFSRSLAHPPHQQQAASLIALHRRAERQRFGLPVLHLLGLGLLGGALVARAWLRSYDAAHPGRAAGPARPLETSLGSREAVRTSAEAAALMEHVREVLSRHGLSLGDVHLAVRVRRGLFAEGLTVKGLRPPPARRGVEEVVLAPGLPALHAAQVLAHEFMHAWLWLQGFPPLEHALEEGLC